VIRFVDKDRKTPRSTEPPLSTADINELYRKLQPEIARSKTNPDLIAAAL